MQSTVSQFSAEFCAAKHAKKMLIVMFAELWLLMKQDMELFLPDGPEHSVPGGLEGSDCIVLHTEIL